MDYINNRIQNFTIRRNLKDAINGLEESERELITSRYYQDMTQKETAEALGISQVQVSRKEGKILEKLKTQIS